MFIEVVYMLAKFTSYCCHASGDSIMQGMMEGLLVAEILEMVFALFSVEVEEANAKIPLCWSHFMWAYDLFPE